MNKNDFYVLFAFLSSNQVIQFKKLNKRYKDFLEKNIVPLQNEETKELQSDISQKIQKEYIRLESKVTERNKLILLQLDALDINHSKLDAVLLSSTNYHYFPNAKKMAYIMEILEEIDVEGLNKTLRGRIKSLEWVNKTLEEIIRDLNKILFEEEAEKLIAKVKIAEKQKELT